MSDNKFSLNITETSSLCFDKEYFMQDEISVDAFVRIHQSSGTGSLETLRDDLGIYLKVLRSAMIDLINNDYADFVNLSTNLAGLDNLIETLKVPLGQIREEVLAVEELLDNAISTTSKDLEDRRSLTKKKTVLQRLCQISDRLNRLEDLLKSEDKNKPGSDNIKLDDTVGSDLVDRLAAEINRLNFLVNQCNGASLVNSFKPRVSWLSSYVEVGLERGLKEGIMNKDTNLLRQTLRTYASLGSIGHAHNLVRTIIKDKLEDVVTEHMLKSNPRGLPGIYDSIMDNVMDTCKPLLQVTIGSRSDIVKDYSFLESAVWPEIVSALDSRMQHIFNPGNPSGFSRRYQQSMDFIYKFEEELKSVDRVEMFRQTPEYHHFIDQWNLPVYFQIRYQEIGQVVESCLVENEKVLQNNGKDSSFLLESSHVVWEAVLQCYSNQVFLLPLLHRFWKLNLLILSRYWTFISDFIKNLQVENKNFNKEQFISSHFQTKYKCVSESSIITSAVSLHHDIQMLADKIPRIYQLCLKDKVDHLEQDRVEILTNILQEKQTKYLDLTPSLVSLIIDDLTHMTCSFLTQVGDTPRLYRRTNRASPTSAQIYINNAVNILETFKEHFTEKISHEIVKKCIGDACIAVCDQYHTLIYDVLSSVHKMEESLKRLKKARDRGLQSGTEASAGLTDDDKIRLQIFIDVSFLQDKMTEWGLDFLSMESFNKLFKMVEDAKLRRFTP